MRIKRSLLILCLSLLSFLRKTIQQQFVYQQSDRVFIKLVQEIYQGTSVSGNGYKDYSLSFPDGQFKNIPSVLYSSNVYNVEDCSAQGFNITTLSVTLKSVNYRVRSFGCVLCQIHFQVVAVDDPQISIVNQVVPLTKAQTEITFKSSSTTNSILYFSPFLSGIRGNSTSRLALNQVQKRVDSNSFTMTLNQQNIQEVYLTYLIIYDTPVPSLYSYSQTIDIKSNNPTKSTSVPWKTDTTLVDGSQILYGLKDIDIQSGGSYFGVKLQTTQKSLVLSNKVQLEYFTWNQYIVNKVNGLQVSFMVKNCPTGQYMYLNSTYSVCTASCSSVDHHFNNNASNKQVLYTLSIVTCQSCNQNCFGCQDGQSDKCIDCYSGKYFNPYTSKCEDTKPQSSYCALTTVQGQNYYNCKKCDVSCLECTGVGVNVCTACKQGISDNKYLYSGKCLINQPASTYCDSSNVCTQCSVNCSSCAGSTSNCLTCQNSKYFYNNTCLDAPYDGIYCNSYLDCKKCDITKCKTCTSNDSNCTTCKSNQYLYNNTCFDQKMTGVYCSAKLDYFECKTCSNTACKECTIETPSLCISCPPSYYFYKGQCLTTQPDKTYCVDAICKDCHSSCQICNGPSQTECTQCVENREIKDSLCACIKGYFQNSLSVCQQCNIACQSCLSDEANSCLTCPSLTQYLYQGECLSHQPPSTYCDDNLRVCYPCNPICKECKGPNSNECTACNPDLSLNINLSTCECGDRQYAVQVNSVMSCKGCDISCKTCDGPTPQHCLTCDHFYYHKQCFDTQPDKTFCDTNQICQLCNSECQSCENSASQCTQCIVHYYHYNNSCLKCYDTCQQCNGPQINQCITCSGSLILQSDGTCGCQSKQFISQSLSSTYTCEKCNPNCQECKGANENDCTSCNYLGDTNSYFYNNTCQSSQPIATYCNEHKVCQDCSKNCLSCTGTNIDNCTSCKADKYFYKSQCLDQPIDKIFCINGICEDCDIVCEKCQNSSTNCTSCKQGEFLQDSKCYQQQPQSTYCIQSGVYSKCQSCDISCVECSGTSKVDCTKCQSDHYLYNHTCLSSQPDRTYCQANVCFDCSVECSACTGPFNKQCTSCISSKVISQLSQLCECPTKTYLSNPQDSTSECIPCVTGCDKCQNSSSCEKCDSLQYLYNNQCVQNKPEKTYCIGNTCKDCHPDCSECTGESEKNCLKCVGDKEIDQQSSLCVCPKGTYVDDSDTQSTKCLGCAVGCMECTHYFNCSVCAKSQTSQKQLFMFQEQCYESEPANAYCDAITFRCEECKQKCRKCDSSLQVCSSCIDNSYLYKGQCLPDKPQKDHVYCDDSTFVCIDCSDNCFNCTNTADSCTQCYQNQYLFNNKCYKVQPQNTGCTYNSLKQHSDCIKCTSSNCSTCNQSLTTCDICIKGLVFDERKESCECPAGNFLVYQQEYELTYCKKCSQTNCLRCDKNICITCNEGFLKNSKQECQYCENSMFTDANNECNQQCPKLCLQCSSANTCFTKVSLPICHISCKTCSGIKETDCFDCSSQTREYDSILQTCKCKKEYINIGQVDCQLPSLVSDSILKTHSTINTISFSLSSVSAITNFVPGLSYSFNLMQILGDFHLKQDKNFNQVTTILSPYTKYNINSLFQQKLQGNSQTQVKNRNLNSLRKQDSQVVDNLTEKEDNKESMISQQYLESGSENIQSASSLQPMADEQEVKSSDNIYSNNDEEDDLRIVDRIYFADNSLIQLCIIAFIFFIAQIIHFYQTRTNLSFKFIDVFRWNLVLIVIQLSSNFMVLTLIQCKFTDQRIIDWVFIAIFTIIYATFILYIFNSIRRDNHTDSSLSILSSGINQKNIYSKYFFLIFEFRKFSYCFVIAVSREYLKFSIWLILGIQVLSIYENQKYKTMLKKSSNTILLISEVLFSFIIVLFGLIININDNSINKIMATCLAFLLIIFSLFSIFALLFIITVKIKETCFKKQRMFMQSSHNQSLDSKVKILQSTLDISQVSQQVKWSINPLKRKSQSKTQILSNHLHNS